MLQMLADFTRISVIHVCRGFNFTDVQSNIEISKICQLMEAINLHQVRLNMKFNSITQDHMCPYHVHTSICIYILSIKTNISILNKNFSLLIIFQSLHVVIEFEKIGRYIVLNLLSKDVIAIIVQLSFNTNLQLLRK
jgi:hypothetical protein